MFKVEIKLDANKIEMDNIYTFNTLCEGVDKLFLDNDLVKEQCGIYIDSGNDDDFAKFWGVIYGLKKQAWFKKYVKSWTWFNEDNIDKDNPEGKEDLMSLLIAGNSHLSMSN